MKGILLRGTTVPSGIDPKKWFDVVFSSDWNPRYTQHTLYASVSVSADAPKELLIRSVSVEATTEIRARPIRAAVNVWGQTRANCQLHDHNYTPEHPPRHGKMKLTVEFEGAYMGEACWEEPFDHAGVS